MPQSVVRIARRVYEDTIGLGLASIQAQVEAAHKVSFEWYSKNSVEIEYLDNVCKMSEFTSTRLRLFNRPPLKLCDPIRDMKAAFLQQGCHRLKFGSELREDVFMLKGVS